MTREVYDRLLPESEPLKAAQRNVRSRRNGCTVHEGIERREHGLRRSDSLAVPLLTRSDWVPSGSAPLLEWRRSWTNREPLEEELSDLAGCCRPTNRSRRCSATSPPSRAPSRRATPPASPSSSTIADHGGGLRPARAAGRRPPVLQRRGPVPRKPADGRDPTEPGARRRHALAELSWTDARRRCRELSVAPVGHRQSRYGRGAELVLPEPSLRRNR